MGDVIILKRGGTFETALPFFNKRNAILQDIREVSEELNQLQGKLIAYQDEVDPAIRQANTVAAETLQRKRDELFDKQYELYKQERDLKILQHRLQGLS